MPPRQTIGIPILRVPSHNIKDPEVRRALEGIAQETTIWLQRLVESIDESIGLRGSPTFHADVNGNGKLLTGLGTPKNDTDAQLKGLSLGRASFSAKAWDARGMSIVNLPKELSTQDSTASMSQEQIRALIDEKIRDAVFGENATFTASAVGFTAAVTGTASYTLVGGTVLLFLPELTGTSNATTFTITGLPAAITPVRTSNHVVTVSDSTTDIYGLLRLTAASTTITMLSALQANGDWGNSGTKAVLPTWVAYGLF